MIKMPTKKEIEKRERIALRNRIKNLQNIKITNENYEKLNRLIANIEYEIE